MPKPPANKNAPSPQETMAKHLALVLSDTYVLAVKMHGYHWNVTGPLFSQLHDFFGKEYTALFEAADVIAERMRALGAFPEGSMAAFLENTVVEEAGDKPLDAQEMLEDLLHSHEQMRERIVDAADFADEVDDIATEDLMVERLHAHDKSIWMIRSQLAG